MVASLYPLTDAKAATAYYEADDYYLADCQAPSTWMGSGAEALGLRGEVEPDAFAAQLAGKLPNGTTLGTVRNGEREHRIGWDLSLGAPKSVSVMALVAGDRRLLTAHNEAVTTALSYAERHVAVTRTRKGQVVEKVATGNLVAALFPHYTARPVGEIEPAPHLHHHGVIANATMRSDGQWASLDSHGLYKLQKQIGTVYDTELARLTRELGYSVTVAPDATFKIDAIPEEVTRAFSSRAEQIEAELAKRGHTRTTATAAEKAIVALDTRQRKHIKSQADLTAEWRKRSDDLGFDEAARRRIVAEAEARALAGELPNATKAAHCHLAAMRAVDFAASKLAERESVFGAAELEAEAVRAAGGNTSITDIMAAVERAQETGQLVARAAPHRAAGVAGFTTRQAIQTEQRMLALEADGRNRFTPLHESFHASRIVAAAELRASGAGHTWTDGQRDATKSLLQSTAATTAIQGYAGTAKTTTVLSTYAQAARAEGYTVRAFAPTAQAAAVLGEAIEAEATTVARLLVNPPTPTAQEVWIVDEASMLSANNTAELLASAGERQARVILVGDVDQLGSVEAGRAFGQLQQAGMPTYILDQIVRQTNTQTLAAVNSLLAGKAEAAFAALDAGGGRVIQHHEQDVRISEMARAFARLSPEQRAQTLVLDPTREGRQQLTEAIRAALIEDGTLGTDCMIAKVLEPVTLTQPEYARAQSYQAGQVLCFRGTAPEKGGLKQGVSYMVEGNDVEAGTVSLTGPRGKPYVWQPGQWGADRAELYLPVEQEFRVGDQLQFTRNNYPANRRNGATAIVTSVSKETDSLAFSTPEGGTDELDFTRLRDRHVRHGWVRTIHSAQGATSERVMAHLESFRVYTVDMKAVYVAISRAKSHAAVYTNNRAELVEVLGHRDNTKQTALEGALYGPPPVTELDAGL